MSEDRLAFSAQQQMAVIGHSLVKTELWDRLSDLGLDKNWFVDPRLAAIYDVIQDYKKEAGRCPNAAELMGHINSRFGIEAASKNKTVNTCITAARHFGYDHLQQKIVDWAKSRIVVKRCTEVAKVFNEGRLDDAYRMMENGAAELQRIDILAEEMPDQMEASSERITREAQQRVNDGKKVLSYGVKYLDDALVGILPNDLVIVGGRTGSGKTELAKIIARHNARQGKRVSFFALEAEDNEIERRMKFSMIIDAWKEENPGVPNPIRYPEWRVGRWEVALSKYNELVDKKFQTEYSTLKTYYRVRGDFGITELDREVIRVHKQSDLIIIDHLHYVDLDGKNENSEMKILVKKLRHLALCLGVPIVCVAHLRKMNGNKTLMPALEDFHGSSDISKIATVCVVLSRADGLTNCEPYTDNGAPTFMRIVKSRMDSNVLTYPAITFFNGDQGGYLDRYALGKLNLAETKWIAVKSQWPRWADMNVVMKEVSDID